MTVNFRDLENPSARRSEKRNLAIAEARRYFNGFTNLRRTRSEKALDIRIKVVAHVNQMSRTKWQRNSELPFVNHNFSQVQILVAHFYERNPIFDAID